MTEKKRHHMPEFKFGAIDQLTGIDLAALIMFGKMTTAGLYSWIDRHGGAAAVHAKYPQIKEALRLVRQEKSRRRRIDKLRAQMAQLTALEVQ